MTGVKLSAHAVLCMLSLIISMAALCRSTNEQQHGPQGAAQSMSRDAIHLELLAEPRSFSMAERDRFKVGIVASNRGTVVIDPELHRARLLINGQDSLIWSDAISNGQREGKWFALPPGEKVSMDWTALGQWLFPGPGVYTLKLRLGDIEAAPVEVRVLP